MMAGPIALVGGDEFRPGCEDMDNAILRATRKDRPRVVILPTAAAQQHPSKAAANGVSYFERLGAMASAAMVLEPEDANDDMLLSPVENADVVYLTGGSPSHLLQTLTESLLLEKLRAALHRGAVLAGSSAGAMVLGSSMRFRQWSEALGILDGVAVLPHHERSDPEKTAAQLRESAPRGTIVLGIDAMTCCFGGPDRWEVLGSGAVTVYDNDGRRRYVAGDVLQYPT